MLSKVKDGVIPKCGKKCVDLTGQEKPRSKLPKASEFYSWASENGILVIVVQVKMLAWAVLLDNQAWTLHAYRTSNILVGATKSWQ